MTNPTCADTHIKRKHDLHNDYYALTLADYPQAKDCRPGQFVHIKLPSSEILFRRAMSVAGADPDRDEVDIIFKVYGRGTRIMGAMHEGDPLNLLGPLGKPFSHPDKSETAVMVAGGVGFPPLLFLTERLLAAGHDARKIVFLYGGRSSGDILYQDRINRLGVDFRPATEDGSVGRKGLVTDPMPYLIRPAGRAGLRLFACGPEPMLKAVNDSGMEYGVNGELSLEAPMPCGIGVCLGCVVPRRDGGHARVCVDGPIFQIGEIAL